MAARQKPLRREDRKAPDGRKEHKRRHDGKKAKIHKDKESLSNRQLCSIHKDTKKKSLSEQQMCYHTQRNQPLGCYTPSGR
mmetsp:Transcript_13491/g.31740  ORF Transcript_13491/g.31740 Transcript_13491/m.31740 type:complete len:81 (-) Transcript_13491:624-866(-)